MSGPADPGTEDAGPAELHLCNSYRQLMLALCGAGGHRATIVYLCDAVPIDAATEARLRALFPRVRFVILSDAALERRFANLPRWLPAVLRRNLRLSFGRGFVRPGGWAPAELADLRFRTGYFYHSGFFAAKVLAPRCDRIVLRESGLNNYATLAVPPLKALLRLGAGLPPRRQIWGEEPWIDMIEVEHPEMLPAPVRAKARRLVWADRLRGEDPARLRALIGALVPDLPAPEQGGRAAVVLTQPIDEIGLCDRAAKPAIYAHLVQRLAGMGYRVYLKNHPRETAYVPEGATALPPALPIEAWEFAGQPPFALAIAFRSAALHQTRPGFALARHQLFDTLVLEYRTLDGWRQVLDERLGALGLGR